MRTVKVLLSMLSGSYQMYCLIKFYKNVIKFNNFVKDAVFKFYNQSEHYCNPIL